MEISPIKNERDYEQAMKKIDALMDAQPNTPEGDQLDTLVTWVEAWEAEHYPIDPE
jgi:HTH-type transcriptional regulator/antitoxin HigA